MAEETRTWNLTEEQWAALRARASSGADALEDGAYVRASAAEEADLPDALGVASVETITAPDL